MFMCVTRQQRGWWAHMSPGCAATETQDSRTRVSTKLCENSVGCAHTHCRGVYTKRCRPKASSLPSGLRTYPLSMGEGQLRKLLANVGGLSFPIQASGCHPCTPCLQTRWCLVPLNSGTVISSLHENNPQSNTQLSVSHMKVLPLIQSAAFLLHWKRVCSPSPDNVQEKTRGLENQVSVVPPTFLLSLMAMALLGHPHSITITYTKAYFSFLEASLCSFYWNAYFAFTYTVLSAKSWGFKALQTWPHQPLQLQFPAPFPPCFPHPCHLDYLRVLVMSLLSQQPSCLDSSIIVTTAVCPSKYCLWACTGLES